MSNYSIIMEYENASRKMLSMIISVIMFGNRTLLNLTYKICRINPIIQANSEDFNRYNGNSRQL